MKMTKRKGINIHNFLTNLDFYRICIIYLLIEIEVCTKYYIETNKYQLISLYFYFLLYLSKK